MKKDQKDWIRLAALDELRRRRPATGAARQGALQSVFEGIAEIAIKVRVDDRIQGAVEITYPKEQQDHRVRAIACLAAQRGRQVPEKKRKKRAFETGEWFVSRVRDVYGQSFLKHHSFYIMRDIYAWHVPWIYRERKGISSSHACFAKRFACRCIYACAELLSDFLNQSFDSLPIRGRCKNEIYVSYAFSICDIHHIRRNC